MAKPWEKYQKQKEESVDLSPKPWERYQGAKEATWLDDETPFGGTYGGAIQTGLDALPVAGGLIGGIVGGAGGAVTGPGAIVTGAGGAALGGAAGEAYKQLGENYFFGKKRAPGEAVSDIALEGGTSALGQAGGNVVGLGGKALAKTPVGKGLIEGAGSALAKTGEALTGIPKKAIETYAKYEPEIRATGKKFGGDIQAAVDATRSKWTQGIDSVRKSLNRQLGEGIENNATKSIKAQPILDELAKQQEKLNPSLYPEALSQIDDVIKRVSSLTKDGELSVKNAHEVKGYLQDLAQSAYNPGGNIFQGGKDVAKGAKGAAALARKGINEAAPEIASANNSLANLRSIEGTMNRNLLKEGETAASILSAGSASNPKNVKTLERLGKATGQDMLGDAEKLYALKTFDDAPVLPMDFTGKSLTRLGLGAGAGYAADGNEGALVGAALTSPMALKGLIRAGRATIQGGNLVINTPAGRQVIGRGLLNQMGIMPEGLVSEESK